MTTLSILKASIDKYNDAETDAWIAGFTAGAEYFKDRMWSWSDRELNCDLNMVMHSAKNLSSVLKFK